MCLRKPTEGLVSFHLFGHRMGSLRMEAAPVVVNALQRGQLGLADLLSGLHHSLTTNPKMELSAFLEALKSF